MLMHDDILPPRAPREPAPPAAGSPAVPAANTVTESVGIELPVDETKIEREFGPAPVSNTDSPAAPATIKQKVMKLLPAMTFRRRVNPRRTLWVLLVGLACVAVGYGTSYALLRYYQFPVQHFAIVHVKPKPKPPALVPSTLTGLMVDPSVNDRQVTAVMIENSIDARPQSGLDQAGVVFEALAEGGVTRFMALYQDTQPDYLGPVRSARPYYIQWLLGFDAAYAHVGGSQDALNDITAWHVKDLNQFYNADAYHRISTRYAPHNVYTSIAELNALEQGKGYTASHYTGFVRKPKEEPSKTPTATSIDIKFSGYYYDSHYDYDPATNTYKRSETGQPHMELHKDGTTAQIAPKVVVAMIVPEQNGALDASGAYYADYASIGTGQVTVFQDGTVTAGTWSKASSTSQLTFTGTDGKPLALNPGQTWIAATPLAGNVAYK